MQPFISLPDLKIYWYGHDYDHYLDVHHTFSSHHPRHHHYNPHHDHLHHDIVAVQEETLNLCLAAAPEVTTVVLEQVRSHNHYNHHDHHSSSLSRWLLQAPNYGGFSSPMLTCRPVELPRYRFITISMIRKIMVEIMMMIIITVMILDMMIIFAGLTDCTKMPERCNH